jgi:hypothetical protein
MNENELLMMKVLPHLLFLLLSCDAALLVEGQA